MLIAAGGNSWPLMTALGRGATTAEPSTVVTTDCTESLKNIDAHQIPVVQHAVGVFTCSRGQYLCNNSLWN